MQGSAKGKSIARGTLDTLWRTMMLKAIADNVITADQCLDSHDLKRGGLPDTGGHKADARVDVYDLERPEVTTPAGV